MRSGERAEGLPSSVAVCQAGSSVLHTHAVDAASRAPGVLPRDVVVGSASRAAGTVSSGEQSGLAAACLAARVHLDEEAVAAVQQAGGSPSRVQEIDAASEVL